LAGESSRVEAPIGSKVDALGMIKPGLNYLDLVQVITSH